MNPKKREAREVGYLAECWVAYELSKRNIRCQRADKDVLECDFITEFGDLIEVKSSRPSWSLNGAKTNGGFYWNFNNHKKIHTFSEGNDRCKRVARDRRCDFFIFLGMDKNKVIKKVFIVPKEEVGSRSVISEPVVRKTKRKDSTLRLYEWENRWDLLNDSEKGNKKNEK